jgi:hypothetical protein
MLNKKMIFRAFVIATICGVVAGVTSCSVTEERREHREERTGNDGKTVETQRTIIEKD